MMNLPQKLSTAFFVLLLWGALAAGSQNSASSYDEMLGSARTLVKQAKYSEAAQLCQSAISTDPSRWEAYGLAGSIAAIERRYEDAISLLDKALEKAPAERKAALTEAIEECKRNLTPKAAPAPAVESEPSQAEILLWKSIENTKNPDDLRAYLTQYPNGVFAVLAKSRLHDLQSQDQTVGGKRTNSAEHERELLTAQKSAVDALNSLGSATRPYFGKTTFSTKVDSAEDCVLTLTTDYQAKEFMGGKTSDKLTLPLVSVDPSRVSPIFVHPDKQTPGFWRLSVNTVNDLPLLFIENAGWVQTESTSPLHARDKMRVAGKKSDYHVNVFGFSSQDDATRAAEIVQRLVSLCRE